MIYKSYSETNIEDLYKYISEFYINLNPSIPIIGFILFYHFFVLITILYNGYKIIEF